MQAKPWRTPAVIFASVVVLAAWSNLGTKEQSLATYVVYQGKQALLICSMENERRLPSITLEVDGAVYGINGIAIDTGLPRQPISEANSELIDQGLAMCRSLLE